jgi:hypothetical protein
VGGTVVGGFRGDSSCCAKSESTGSRTQGGGGYGWGSGESATVVESAGMSFGGRIMF